MGVYGYIDDFRIYNRIITVQEMYSIGQSSYVI